MIFLIYLQINPFVKKYAASAILESKGASIWFSFDDMAIFIVFFPQ